MLILPTINRPNNLIRFIDAYNATGGTLPIFVIFDAANAHEYNDVKTPSHWKRCSVPSGFRLGDIFNLVFNQYPNEIFYGMVADDVVPETQGWDIILRDACLSDKIAWGACGQHNEKLPIHPFIGGNLIRRWGFWSAPGVKHWFIDNIWKAFADELNCGAYLPDVKMTHHHCTNGMAPMDLTYSSQPAHMGDRYACERFMREEFVEAVERARR